MTDTIVNCLLRQQYSTDSLRFGDEITRLAWMLAFEPGCAPQPNKTMKRPQMIMEEINKRIPSFAEEEASADLFADQPFRQDPHDRIPRLAFLACSAMMEDIRTSECDIP